MQHEPVGPDAMLQRGNSDHLVVVFSSIASIYTRQYECLSLFEGRREHILFLRDPTPLAYHTGLTALTGSIPETVDFLNYFSASLGVRRRTFFGVSSGGYAAILHAALCGVDDVLAINPATFISETVARKLNCPTRKRFRLDAFRKHYDALNQALPFGDLAEELTARAGAVRLLGVHYAANDRKDNINAGHIADCAGVHAIAHQSDMHALLAIALAEQGVINHHISTPLDTLEQDYAALARQQAGRA